jgi:eukaryotic-like serine/threonine-protein kinase
MSTRREDRYPSAVEFARALQRVELELGYASTNIEVPNLATERESAPDDDADATRARSVRSVEAQPVAPMPSPATHNDDATRARMPRAIDAQPAAGGVAADATPDDGTVIRSAAPIAGAPVAGVDETVVRPRRTVVAGQAPVGSAPATPQPAREASGTEGGRSRPKRSRVASVVGIAAGVVVVGAIGVAIALSGTLQQGAPDPTTAPVSEDAILEATVPTPDVEPGVPAGDGSGISFAVSHENAEEGDRYRWQRADGSGATEVADGPTILVDGVGAGDRVCIDVQVQRGSKTSETTTGCTS